MFELLITLGQSRQLTDEDKAEIFFWSGVLVALGVFIGIAGFIAYRRLKRQDEPDPDANEAGFSLSEMRRLYEAGEMSHEEYVQVRDRVLAAAKKSMLGDDAMTQVKPAVKDEPPSNPPPAPPPNLPPEIDTTPLEYDPEDETDSEGEKKDGS